MAALPWVERAEVHKRWPDVLEVRIVEHHPFARWGDDRLLSREGELFPATNVKPPANLPLLDGPDARVADVVAMYNESVRVAREAGDDRSRDLFSKLLADEEEHVDWLEAQMHQIGEIGYERYLSNQTEGPKD